MNIVCQTILDLPDPPGPAGAESYAIIEVLDANYSIRTVVWDAAGLPVLVFGSGFNAGETVALTVGATRASVRQSLTATGRSQPK